MENNWTVSITQEILKCICRWERLLSCTTFTKEIKIVKIFWCLTPCLSDTLDFFLELTITFMCRWLWLCICHKCTDAHGAQNYRKFRNWSCRLLCTFWCGCWEINLRPLEEQQYAWLLSQLSGHLIVLFSREWLDPLIFALIHFKIIISLVTTCQRLKCLELSHLLEWLNKKVLHHIKFLRNLTGGAVYSKHIKMLTYE